MDSITELLIENGAEVDGGVGYYSPLHYVFLENANPSRKIIELLIKHGANINAVSLENFGSTPLMMAVISSDRGNCI